MNKGMFEVKTISFNKAGYDPFIDFIKAYAIICVLIGHTFPYLDYLGYGLWAGMQVPLFVLIQSFHFFKKDSTTINIKKLCWRVLVPFLMTQSVLFIIILFGGKTATFLSLLKAFIIEGGDGPGSYFPWVYLQLAFILPLVAKFMKTKSRCTIAVFFMIICEGFEIISSIIDLPELAHRLLAIRYFFLLYLGWIWVEEGIIINWRTFILSILSMLSIVYFEYFSVNDEPIFYNTLWKFHRWPCYYYVAILGGYLLYLLYKMLSRSIKINNCIKIIAKCSYEIFLVQMFVITLVNPFLFSQNIYVHYFLVIIMVFVSSLIGGYYLEHFYSLFLKKYIFNHGIQKSS